MKNILDADGQAALRDFALPGTLCAFDFDGTLAPLMEHPELVTLDGSIKRRLDHLQSVTPVAILSGRRRSDLLRFFSDPPYALVGNHGAETGDAPPNAAMRAACDGWVAQAGAMLAGHIDGGDAWVENKSCSITVHCRTREITPAVADVFADPRVLTPPARIIVGPLSVNLLLPDLPTKGDAVRKLMEDAGCARAVYIGDEETDEYVFRLRDPRILGVRVGRGEASAAPYFLESQSDIGAFIDSLIAVYEKARSERA